jgi:hypothetical protein
MSTIKGIISDEKWQDIRLDPASHFLVTIDEIDYLLHQGDLFIWKTFFELAGNPTPGVKTLMIQYPTIPADGEYFVRWSTSGRREYGLHFFIGTDPEFMGNPISYPNIVNKRIGSPKPSALTIYEDGFVGTGSYGIESSKAVNWEHEKTSGVTDGAPILIPAGQQVWVEIRNRSPQDNVVDLAFEFALHFKRDDIPYPE